VRGYTPNMVVADKKKKSENTSRVTGHDWSCPSKWSEGERKCGSPNVLSSSRGLNRINLDRGDRLEKTLMNWGGAELRSLETVVRADSKLKGEQCLWSLGETD